MAHFKVRQGYNVPIKGQAKQKVEELAQAPFVAVCPVEFEQLKPKLLVEANDQVQIGTPLFFDKKRTNLKIVSPASGRVAAINYGPRRIIEEIVIATDEEPQYREHERYDIEALAEFSRDALIDHLMEGGVWPFIKQRPFNRIAHEQATPKGIFVNCMDTAPLANDPNFSLKDFDDWFEAGVEAMKILGDGRVHIVTDAKGAHAGFSRPRGVTHHSFTGPHPAGLVGTHISKIDPINRKECVWTVHARDLVLIGGFLLKGSFQNQRIVAIAGPGSTNPRYVVSQIGAKLSHVTEGSVADGEIRYVSGNLLTGRQSSQDGYLGFYDDLVSLVVEGRNKHFLGWLLPGFGQASFTRVMPAGFTPSKKFAIDTNVHGGHRAIIQSGLYDRVTALDIHPEFLIKAALANDIEAMERLGILECDSEDFALCAYVCPSKTDVMSIVKEGLELVEKEG